MKKLLLGIILFAAQNTLAKTKTACFEIFQVDFFDSLLAGTDRTLEAWHPKHGSGYIAKVNGKWIFDQNWELGHRDSGPKVKDQVAVVLPWIQGSDSLNPALGYEFETILDIKKDIPVYHQGKIYKTFAVMANKTILVRNEDGLIKLTLDQVNRGILTLAPHFLERHEILNVIVDGEVQGTAKVRDIKGVFAEIYFILDKGRGQSSIYSNYSHRTIWVPISLLSRQKPVE